MSNIQAIKTLQCAGTDGDHRSNIDGERRNLLEDSRAGFRERNIMMESWYSEYQKQKDRAVQLGPYIDQFKRMNDDNGALGRDFKQSLVTKFLD